MPIANKSDIKKLLQVPEADTSKDEFIDLEISLLQPLVIELTNNSFKVDKVGVEDSSISFATNKIIDSNNQFVEAGFKAGMDIVVENSLQNDGVYTIAGVTAGEITLTSSTLIEEAEGELLSVTRVKFPSELKRTIAKMIQFDLNNKPGLSSESLGDYAAGFTNSYPADILADLSLYNKLKWD